MAINLSSISPTQKSTISRLPPRRPSRRQLSLHRFNRCLTPLPTFDLNRAVTSASSTYQLDPDLVTSVIRAESNFNISARSPKGAQGLMQLMPQTATQLGVQNAFDPQANVEGGTRYLRQLLERYDFDLIKALAAYNAGPERIDQYHGVPPYYETKAYVARIVRDFNKKKLAAKSAASPNPPKRFPRLPVSFNPKQLALHRLTDLRPSTVRFLYSSCFCICSWAM